MPQDFQFDPITRDLVDDGKGSFALTDTAETMVMHQIWCDYDAWWGDETLGSRFGDLRNFQTNPALQVVDEAKRCLGVIVGRGRIANVESIAELDRPGRVVAQTTMQDVGTGQVINAFVTPGG